MIQVGAREDSSIYVKMKDKAAKEVILLLLLHWYTVAGMNIQCLHFRLASLLPWKSCPRLSVKANF